MDITAKLYLEENLHEEDFYAIDVKCLNCGLERLVYIRKNNLLKDVRCTHCGCKTLTIYNPKIKY